MQAMENSFSKTKNTLKNQLVGSSQKASNITLRWPFALPNLTKGVTCKAVQRICARFVSDDPSITTAINKLDVLCVIML